MKLKYYKHFLGDDGCGKTSLITRLRTPGDDELKKGAGLEYTYLNIHDEERDGISFNVDSPFLSCCCFVSQV